MQVRPSAVRPAALVAAVAAALIAAAAGLAAAAPANADVVAQYHVTDDISGRTSPTAAPGPDYGAPAGATIDVDCQIDGEPVGTLGNTLYFWASYQGVYHYYPDTWTDSPHHAGEPPIAGIPMCGGGQGTSVQTDDPITYYASTYDGAAAAGWAVQHASDTQPFDAACTWFASQALWAGGLAQTTEWTADGQHGRVQKRPGTVTATAAPNLLRYLKSTYPATYMTRIDLGGNAVPEAAPGDLIAYDWDDSAGESSDPTAGIDHISVIVDIQPGSYPNVSEWGTVGGGSVAPYNERGWTYSELNHRWLQDDHPHTVAYLVHIDNGTPVTY